MKRGTLQIYYGSGKGKTTAALGQAIKEASRGRSVFVVQFLKGRQPEEIQFIQRLEPEIKVFCFEKSEKDYQSLSPEEQQEEVMNIKNGLNFARKVLITEECEMLILDEILSALELGIVSEDEVKGLIEAKDDETELILTGTMITDALKDAADRVVSLEIIK